MRIGMFYPELNIKDSDEVKFRQCGYNTGNNVFWYSLRRLLNIERIPYDYEKKKIDINSYDAIITTDLIWIQGDSNFPFLEDLIKKTTVPIIPISVGLQADDYNPEFTIIERTINLLKDIQERAVIGVRGEYTASILNKYGVKNFKIIGCPSMYYWNNPELKILDNVTYPNNFLSNFRTFYGCLTQKEKHFLSYSAGHNAKFIEQTALEFELKHANDSKYFQYVNAWLKKEKSTFFSIDEWMKNTCMYDFSIGGRFHGNVISLWNNIKSLFIVSDSRTKELTSHFLLPTIRMDEFNRDKDIKYYYELANYSEFNQKYKKRFREFIGFLNDNNICISDSVKVLQFANSNTDKLSHIKTLL